MGKFTNGVLVGLGISLLFAPMKGEEARRLLMERLQMLRGGSQGKEESRPRMQPMTGSVQVTPPTAVRATDLGGTVQPDLGNVVQPDLGSTASSLETDISPTTPLPKPSTESTQNKRSQS